MLQKQREGSKRLDFIWSDSTRVVDGGKLGPGPGRAENQGDFISYDSAWLGGTTRWPFSRTAGAASRTETPQHPLPTVRQLMECRPHALWVTSDPHALPPHPGEPTHLGHSCLSLVRPGCLSRSLTTQAQASPPHSSSLMAPNWLVYSTRSASQPITPSN